MSQFAAIILLSLTLFGIACNAIVFAVFRRRTFNKVLARNYFCMLSLTEALSLSTIIPYNLPTDTFYFLLFDQYSCKIITFCGYFLPAVSSWLLALVSIERFVSVKYNHIHLLGCFGFQIFIFGSLFLWNFAIYFCLAVYTNLSSVASDNSSVNSTYAVCIPDDLTALSVFPWLDSVNSVMLPFLVMLACSVAIIHSIYTTRKTLMSCCVAVDIKKLRRDIRFSVIIVSLSFMFLVFNLPMCLYCLLYPTDPLGFQYAYLPFQIVYYMQYIFNIFVYVILNSKFRTELCLIFRLTSRTDKSFNLKIINPAANATA